MPGQQRLVMEMPVPWLAGQHSGPRKVVQEMAIRKTGAATGKITEVENTGSISKTAASDSGWTPDDERELAAEDGEEERPR